jgi:hypothetical protein
MKPLFTGLSILVVSLASSQAQFNPGPNPITGTVTSSQTLSSGTGTVNSAGFINVSGVGVTMSGSSTLVNSGTIHSSGGRAINNSANNSILTIDNSGRISAVATDAIRVDSAATRVSITNSGTISVSNGGQAIDLAAITTGSNTVTNLAGGVISSVGEDAVRPGTNGVVNNAGLITAALSGGASPAGSDGIDLRTFTGISVTNTGTISGRHGIATDGANTGPSTLTVTNNAGGTIQAFNGSGINVDGLSVSVTANITNAFGATIKGGVDAAATNGDGDGVDVDGIVTLNNSGDILGLGAKGVGSDGGQNNAEGISIGGGTITNNATGRIIGSTTSTDAPNGNPTRAGNGILVDNSSGGNALAALNLTNSGFIQGKTGFAVKMVGTFADQITNNSSGTIRGAGTGAAIQTGDGGDTITNRGTIISDIGNAIDLEAGNDTMIVGSGNSTIVGNISGGTGVNTMTVQAGAGGTFTYSGTISNFSSVTVESGSVNVANKMSVVGSLFLDDEAQFAFDVSGLDRGVSYDALDVSGLFTLQGDVIVTSSYVFALNDTLNLIDFGSIDASGFNMSNLILPTLGEGLSWNTSSFTTDGSVSVVPEPSTGLLIFGGSALLALMRRRRTA